MLILRTIILWSVDTIHASDIGRWLIETVTCGHCHECNLLKSLCWLDNSNHHYHPFYPADCLFFFSGKYSHPPTHTHPSPSTLTLQKGLIPGCFCSREVPHRWATSGLIVYINHLFCIIPKTVIEDQRSSNYIDFEPWSTNDMAHQGNDLLIQFSLSLSLMFAFVHASECVKRKYTSSTSAPSSWPRPTVPWDLL